MTGPSAKRFSFVLALYVVYRAARTFLFEDPVSSAAVTLSAEYLLGPAAQWALIGLLFYTLSAGKSGGFIQSRWMRIAFAGITVWYTVVWYRLWNPGGPLPPTAEALGLTLLALTLLSVALFVLLTSDVRTSIVITVGCFLLGLTTSMLVSLSPIPELLIVGLFAWAGVEYVRSGTTTRRRWFDALDVEQTAGAATVAALRSEKGAHALVLCLFGLLISVIPLLALAWMFTLSNTGSNTLLDLGVLVILVGTLGPYAGYGIWFWSSVLRRVSAYLDHRDGSTRPSDVPRPVGLFVPASVYMLGFTILFEYPQATRYGLVAIGAGVIAMAVSYRWTRNFRPQSVTTERYAIPVALVVQLPPWYLLDGEWGWASMAVLMVALFFVPELRNWNRRAAIGVIATALVVFIVSVWPPDADALLALPSIPVVIMLLVAIVYSFDNRTPKHRPKDSPNRDLGVDHDEGMSRRDLLTTGVSIAVVLSSIWFLLLREDTGPKAVAESFLQASYGGDVETADDLLHEDSPDAWLHAPWNPSVEGEVSVAIEDVAVIEQTNEVAVVRATVIVTMADGGESVYREQIELRKESGAWKVYRLSA